MPAAGIGRIRRKRFGSGVAWGSLPMDDRGSASRGRRQAARASAHICAPHCSPRWSAAPQAPTGTGRSGARSRSGSDRGFERLANRLPAHSLVLGSQSQPAGGLQAGAPAESTRTTRPPAPSKRHPNPPAGEAGAKEEKR